MSDQDDSKSKTKDESHASHSSPLNTTHTTPVSIEQEMRQSYLSYAMSVIVGRALPDVRDGLKPVHRRVLYAMHGLGNEHNKPYKKSARIIGDVIGKYHPHGDSAVYDALVRMAQDFSLRYPLIDGQGNFGSIDGDEPAAMRYTEVRMQKITQSLLNDLDKETVDFVSNYDDSEKEPAVLPSRIPNLLINGSDGIAVGMATKIPPHNLTEVMGALLALIENPEMNVSELMEHLPGPDFPTAGSINGSLGIKDAYETGRGKIYLSAKTHIETLKSSEREAIIVTELPYQINKSRLIERIADLVREKRVEGISAIRDESNRQGIRMVIELKKGEVAEVVLNNLYTYTDLQCSYGINLVALINQQPKLLNLKEILQAFISFRKEVVLKRSLFELNKARARAHLLEALALALGSIDFVVELIRQSKNAQEAKTKLMEHRFDIKGLVEVCELDKLMEVGLFKQNLSLYRLDNLPKHLGLHLDKQFYQLSEPQAQAILDMRLQRLTGLEQDKIIEEYRKLLDLMDKLILILQDSAQLKQTLIDEFEEVIANYGDERKTEILPERLSLETEDLIAKEVRVVTFSQAGYIKSQTLADYSAQKRGGRGRTASKFKLDDTIHDLFVASSHDYLLCFSNRGRVYWVKVYQLPLASNQARGKPIVNLLNLQQDETIQAILPIDELKKPAKKSKDNQTAQTSETTENTQTTQTTLSDDKDLEAIAPKVAQFVLMATQKGRVVKCPLEQFSRPRANGINAVNLGESGVGEKPNNLVQTLIVKPQDEVMLFTHFGKVIRFKQSDVRLTNRGSQGVKGISLSRGDYVVSMVIPKEGQSILTTTENGYGKKSTLDDYRLQKRGGSGLIAIKTSERNGQLVAALALDEGDEFLMISQNGIMVRTSSLDIPTISRNTQGVRLIRLDDGNKLTAIARIMELEEDATEEVEDT